MRMSAGWGMPSVANVSNKLSYNLRVVYFLLRCCLMTWLKPSKTRFIKVYSGVLGRSWCIEKGGFAPFIKFQRGAFQLLYDDVGSSPERDLSATIPIRRLRRP